MHILVVFSAESVKNVEELDFGVDDGHPAEILLKEQQEGEECLPPDDYGVMLDQSHQAGQEPITLNWLMSQVYLRGRVLHSFWGGALRAIQESQQDLINLGVNVLCKGLIKDRDECLLNSWRALGQRIAEKPGRDLVENQWE